MDDFILKVGGGFLLGVVVTLAWSWKMGILVVKRLLQTTTPSELADWQQTHDKGG